MSKIQGNLPQAFHFQPDTGATKGKEKTSEGSSSLSETSTSDVSGEGEVSGAGHAHSDLSQGGFDTNEQSKGVLDVVEERQRRLQEDGLSDKLLGGVGDSGQRVLHRNLSGPSKVQSASALQNVEAIGQTTRSRSVSRSSLQNRRDVGNAQETAGVTPRKPGAALDDDLPRVGFTKK